MSRCSPSVRRSTCGSRVLCGSFVLAVSAALAGAADARADNVFGPKVDDAVAAVAVVSTLDAPLDVVVFGTRLDSVNRKLGVAPTHVHNALGAETITIPVQLLDDLAAQPTVTYIAPDLPLGTTAAGTPAPLVVEESSLLSLYPTIDGATWAWAQGYTGEGVTIGVVDSGSVAADDFGKRLFQDYLHDQPLGQVEDRLGHGSLVASIAAGWNPLTGFAGVAPGAGIYALNVSRRGVAYTSDVLEGLEQILAVRGAGRPRVLVLALTEPAPSSYKANALTAMLEKIWNAGIVVVVAAGNSGKDSALYAPANDPFVISVGALNDNRTLDTADDGQPGWSTHGITQDGFAKPDLLAPGRLVTGLLPHSSYFGRNAPEHNWMDVEHTYARASGSSFAAPQVAAAAAILLQARPDLTPNQVKWLLKTTARPVVDSAAGALDIKAALSYTGEVGSANQGVEPSPYAASTWKTTNYRNAHAGNGWSGNGWSGNGWSGNGWSGNGWSGNGWSGNGWSGNGWSWYQEGS